MSDLIEDLSKLRDAAIGYDREVYQRTITTINQLQARVIVLEDIVGEHVNKYGCNKENYAIVDECYENWQNRSTPPEHK